MNMLLHLLSVMVIMTTPTRSYCQSNGLLYNFFPDNVRQSFSLGVKENGGLSRTHLEAMAAANLRSQKVDESTLITLLGSKSDSQLADIATRPFLIDYYEIPEQSLLTEGEVTAERTQYNHSNEPSPLRFLRDGKVFLRWFIHPLRPKPVLKGNLQSLQLKCGRFLGMMTESRSVVIQDRTNGHFWSLKISLPSAMGQFSNKTYTSKEAQIHFRNSERIFEQQKNGNLNNPQFFQEIEYVAFKMEGTDEGQLLRSLSFLKDRNLKFIPYSSIYTHGLHKYIASPEMGPKAQGGLTDDERTWLADEPALAAKKLYDDIAAVLNSNHSQNSVLLINQNRQPLRFMQRDLDFDYDLDHKSSRHGLDKIDTTNKTHEIKLDFSMLNGFTSPERSYYSEVKYKEIVVTFFTRVVSEITGGAIPVQDAFAATFINYTIGASEPERIRNIDTRHGLNRSGHYLYEMSIVNKLPNLKMQFNESRTKKITEVTNQYPFLNQLPSSSNGVWSQLLFRENQKKGDITKILEVMIELDGMSTIKAFEHMIKEFENPFRRQESLVFKVITNVNPIVPWNFTIVLAKLYRTELRENYKTIIVEYSKRPMLLPALALMIKKIQDTMSVKPDYQWRAVDIPTDYREFMETVISAANTIDAQLSILENYGQYKLDLMPELVIKLIKKLHPKAKEWVANELEAERKKGLAFYIFMKNEKLFQGSPRPRVIRCENLYL